MSMRTKAKLEISSGYKDRLQALLRRAFGRIPEETSYSQAGRCLGLSHSSIKSWVEGSLKWEIHPTSVNNLAEILQKPAEKIDSYLRYGSSLEIDRDDNSAQITLAEIKEIITRRNYRPTSQDSLYLAEIGSAVNNLILEAEISKLKNQQNASSVERTYQAGASHAPALSSTTHKIIPFASIKTITSYLQSKIKPGKYQDFFRACPLIDNYSADIIEIILKGKTEILPLETVEGVLPAIARGLGACLDSQETLFLQELKILLNH